MNADDVDWTPFDSLPESTVTCGCGRRFRSHSKVVSVPDALTPSSSLVIFSRKRCPNCGADDQARRVESDPERYTL